MSEVLTIKEYANKYGVAVTTVHKQRERGLHPGAYKRGQQWFIPDEAPKYTYGGKIKSLKAG